MEESDAKKGRPENPSNQSSSETSVPETPGDSFDGATMMDAPTPPRSAGSPAPEATSDMTFIDGPTTPPVPRTAVSRSVSGVYAAGGILNAGDIVGERYEILELLGEGGMGAVYKARDRELDRMVALKVVRPELARNPEIVRRFKQELILARQITDRNIIRIFDLGEADGIKFITMEYVEGESLFHMLRERGKLPVDEAVEILEQVFDGLRAAHREGVIHRDLKPGNIMRDRQGRVVVMDFGLARTMEGDGMTRTGAMLGTMEYMSPEQAQALDLDARSDIYTMGLIGYELLSGKMPFHAESAIASLLRRTRERAVPISDISRDVPSALSNIISKCLERDPALRYQSAQAVLDDLYAYQGKGDRARISVSPAPLALRSSACPSWCRRR